MTDWLAVVFISFFALIGAWAVYWIIRTAIAFLTGRWE